MQLTERTSRDPDMIGPMLDEQEVTILRRCAECEVRLLPMRMERILSDFHTNDALRRLVDKGQLVPVYTYAASIADSYRMTRAAYDRIGIAPPLHVMEGEG